MQSVRPGNHFEVIYLENDMVRVRVILVHLDHFRSSCYGQHCSVGLLWGLYIGIESFKHLSIFALPMRYSCISIIRQNETSCKVLWDLGFSLTSETFVFKILFHFLFSMNSSFFSDLILIVIFSRIYIFFSDFRIFLGLVNFFF